VKTFLAATAKIRNGRPNVTIRSFLTEEQMTKQSITVDAALSLLGPIDADSHGLSLDGKSTTDPTYRSNVRKRLRLELRSSRSERTAVIQAWWKYAVGAVVWEIQQKRRLRSEFQKKYLTFDWEKQKYKRKSYVSLYIQLYLKNVEEDEALPSRKAEIMAQSIEFLSIEDELPVEQILLYRSIARSIHVRGGTAMPASLRDLRDKCEEKSQQPKQSTPSPNLMVVSESTNQIAKSRSGDSQERDSVDELPNMLTLMERMCKVARGRKEESKSGDLDEYGQHIPLHRLAAKAASPFGFDEKSMDLTTDSRTIKTFKTTKSKFTRVGIQSSLKESMASSDKALDSIVFSFSAKIEMLELMLVDDDNKGMSRFDDQYFRDNARGGGGADSAANFSDISALTDEHRDFAGMDLDQAIAIDEESVADPIMCSTDFLLFRVPDNVVLRIAVKSASFSVNGRSGGSRNVNLSIGKVDAVGETGLHILKFGSDNGSEESITPLPDFQIVDKRNSVAHSAVRSIMSARNAFTISIVLHNNEGILVSDMSLIKSCIDFTTLHRLHSILCWKNDIFPEDVLPKSARENLRLLVLQQNKPTGFERISVSVRLNGLEFTLLGAAKRRSITHDDDNDMSYSYGDDLEQEQSNGFDSIQSSRDGVQFRIALLEFYSGDALDELSSAANSLSDVDYDQSEGSDVITPIVNDGKPLNTRQFRMLDVVGLSASKSSILSLSWVSVLCCQR
jgi:hypothetical protein